MVWMWIARRKRISHPSLLPPSLNALWKKTSQTSRMRKLRRFAKGFAVPEGRTTSRTRVVSQGKIIIARGLLSSAGMRLIKKKTRMERKCEAAPGPFAVPVHVPIRITASDIGCELIFWAPTSDASVGTGHDHQWGFLESVSWRTIRPSDGSPAWKARIFAVRTTFIHRNGLETQKLCGVHETRIISVVPGHH